MIVKPHLHYDSDSTINTISLTLMRMTVYIRLHYLGESTTYRDNFYCERSH